MTTPDKEILEDWRTNPKYWKVFGLFYYNKEDERLMVDKPNPNYGTTLNFANRKSYIFLLIILAFFGFVGYTIVSSKK